VPALLGCRREQELQQAKARGEDVELLMKQNSLQNSMEGKMK
jgi:hypothetical protein